MINVAVISEYNPFHYGHKNQIDYLRAKFDEDITVISLMSGNYVQRGEPSIISKYKRAEIAVNNGIDLVLEYPFTLTFFAPVNLSFKLYWIWYPDILPGIEVVNFFHLTVIAFLADFKLDKLVPFGIILKVAVPLPL